MNQGIKHIYADNAATTPLSRKAYAAMLPYLLDDFGNASQLYAFARTPKKALKEARAAIADCIGALPEEIFFTSGGTESNNWVIRGAIQKQMSIITSSIEHHSILNPCLLSKNITYLSVTDKGVVLPSVLSEHFIDKCGLVSIMFANNEIGTIEPILELSSITHQHGWTFHTDAVQAIGHLPIKVHELGVDLLSASAHKFNGPKGIGFLYVKKGVAWPPLLLGGAQEFNHRAGTENVASIVGMAVALQENVVSMKTNTEYLCSLENLLFERLNNTGIEYRRNGAEEHIPGSISLSFVGKDGEAILHRLDLRGISVSTGSACDSNNTQLSHVLRAIHLGDIYAKGTIRISLGCQNTESDIDTVVKTLALVVK